MCSLEEVQCSFRAHFLSSTKTLSYQPTNLNTTTFYFYAEMQSSLCTPSMCSRENNSSSCCWRNSGPRAFPRERSHFFRGAGLLQRTEMSLHIHIHCFMPIHRYTFPHVHNMLLTHLQWGRGHTRDVFSCKRVIPGSLSSLSGFKILYEFPGPPAAWHWNRKALLQSSIQFIFGVRNRESLWLILNFSAHACFSELM